MTNVVRAILLIGAPGSGKGTQASRLAQEWGMVSISTGDIFRAHVAEQTSLGLEAQQYIDGGHYVPDSVTNRMVENRLEQHDIVQGFVLDGYPRTLEQVQAFDAMLDARGYVLERVVRLVVDDEVLFERLSGRARLEGRSDDTADVIQHRLTLYTNATEPVIRTYEQRGIVVSIDGARSVSEVTEHILKTVTFAQPIAEY